MNVRRREITIEGGSTIVSGLLNVPENARAVYVLAHGAGAGMRHRFMDAVAEGLASRGVATLRYQFPYMEEGRKRPDVPNRLTATVRRAVERCAVECPGLPIFAGGKSLGGRMTSTAQATEPLPDVRGLVFLGFPLHPPNRPSSDRAEHLSSVEIPMLFLQGTRDALADLTLMRPVCDELGDRARLQIIDGADHSFGVLKRSGRTPDEVMAEMLDTAVDWMDRLTT